MAEESLHLLCMLWADEGTIEQDGNIYYLKLKRINQKVLYSTSRPKKVRGYIESNHFIFVWSQNNDAFDAEPAEIAMSYSNLSKNKYGISNAIAANLSNPTLTKDGCVFNLKWRDEKVSLGTYKDIALFIDWLPTTYCPKPISLLMP